MAKVTKMNGEKGTTEGMFSHQFSGKPPSQFEFRVGDSTDTVEGLGAVEPGPYVGSTFRVVVEAKLVGRHKKDMKDGVEEVLSLRVVNSGPLQLLERGHQKPKDETDPNQMEIPTSEEYGDYSEPKSEVPAADAVKDGPAFSDGKK